MTSPFPQPSLPPPTPGLLVANRYRVDTVFGQGSQGIVCSATDLRRNRRLLLIYVSPSADVDEATNAELLRRARADTAPPTS